MCAADAHDAAWPILAWPILEQHDSPSVAGRATLGCAAARPPFGALEVILNLLLRSAGNM